jgi:hypothetical protein
MRAGSVLPGVQGQSRGERVEGSGDVQLDRGCKWCALQTSKQGTEMCSELCVGTGTAQDVFMLVC